MRRAYHTALTVGLSATVLSLLLPPSLGGEVLYTATSLAAAGSVLVASRRARTAVPQAWALLGLALVVSGGGDVTWFVLEARGLEPYPSLADVFYLASYPLFVAALWRLGSRGVRQRGALIDALIIGVSAAVLGWVFLLEPYATDPMLGGLERITSMAYPVGDLVVLPFIARLVFEQAGRVRAHLLLMIGMVSWLVGDAIFVMGSLDGWYASGGPLDGTWLLAYACFAAAPWHPSAIVTLDADDTVETLTGRRLVALAAASLLAPTLLLVLDTSGTSIARITALASIVLFLLVLGRMAGLMRRVREQREELYRLSRLDPLTGVLNRRGVDEELHREHQRSSRNGTPFSVAILDVDRFKRFNDTYGHPAGDAFLRALVDGWQTELRAQDRLGRLGGEEFIILLPGCGAAEAVVAIERVRARVPGQETASAGIAEWRPEVGLDELLSAADAALYVAKRDGRDRTEVAAGTPRPVNR